MTVDLGLASLDTMLAVAAMLLGLALIVQVIQEIYKYLTNSKARVYHLVLKDYFGPWVDQLYEAGPATRFQVRGPFQFFKSQPTGVLLPLAKDELLEAMDAVAPDWIGHTLEALKNERRLQAGEASPPSPILVTLVENLRSAAEKESAHSNAHRMLDFLTAWGVVDQSGQLGERVNAHRALEGLYQRFFPDRIRTEQEFGQLERNYKHAYNRRNLRYTFLFGLLVAVALNFPFHAIYRQASMLSPEEAAALAEAVLDAEERLGELRPLEAAAAGEEGEGTDAGEEGEGPDAGEDEQPAAPDQPATTPPVGTAPEDGRAALAQRREWIEGLVTTLVQEDASEAVPLHRRGLVAMTDTWSANGIGGIGNYLLNCLLTALLLSFGAPFWHRLSEALLDIRRGRPPARADEEEV